jgi:hypothetical protein
MPWKVEVQPGGKVVRIEASGEMGVGQVRQMGAAAIAEAAKAGTITFLADCRDMTPRMTTMEIYDLPDDLGRIGAKPGSRLAVLMSETSGRKEDISFFEAVSVNRGYRVRLFTDPGEAEEWIAEGR